MFRASPLLRLDLCSAARFSRENSALVINSYPKIFPRGQLDGVGFLKTSHFTSHPRGLFSSGDVTPWELFSLN